MTNAVEAWFGDHFGELHPQLQTLHRHGGTLSGNIDLCFGRGIAGLLGRRLARRVGIPTIAGVHALQVQIYSVHDELHWNRCFNASTMFRSTFIPVGTFPSGHWIEQSSSVQLLLTVRVVNGGWHWQPVGAKLGALSLPAACLPRGIACKEIAGGLYHFRVSMALPLLGKLLEYGGNLRLAARPAQDLA